VSHPTHSDELPTISIVGLGNLGTALASTLSSAGYGVKAVVVRSKSLKSKPTKALARRLNARVLQLGNDALDTGVVWIAVPDDAIAEVARTLARSQSWKGKVVFHSSGALTSDELAPLREQGARVAAVHPMMTFVRGAVPQMAGVAFAVEGDAVAVRTAKSIVKRLGGNAFPIRKENKVLYHVFGSFASPLVIALLSSLEDVALAAGIRKQDIKPIMVPLLWQTLHNYLKHDTAAAFSGPLVRGDAATIRKHLAELKKLPQAREIYLALTRSAIRNLPVKNQRQLEKELRK
jgi:predicted short-subunit dehydrogenase-like oxidoreductase (DUF2520 family)